MMQTDNLAGATNRLAQQIAQWTGSANQFTTPIPGLRLSRWLAPTPPVSYTLNPSICLIAQGKKQIMLGKACHGYDANHFLLSSVDLPVIANIVEASPAVPYLGLVMALDLPEIAGLIAEVESSPGQHKSAANGIVVGELSAPLRDAFVRLLALLDEPASIKILAPVIKREIFYRLLLTSQGERLKQIVSAGSHSHQISRAVGWLKSNYVKSLSVGELAAYAGMSKSAFYTHFRTLTSMTPLQFQKRLRLNEARRLMLMENMDAMATTFQVGYESPSQFCREYSRMFGAPPARDIKALRSGGQTGNPAEA